MTIFLNYIFCFVYQIDKNKNGFLDCTELKEALEIVGCKLPGWQLRRILEESEVEKSKLNKLSYQDFEKVRIDRLLAKEFLSFKDLKSF